MSSLLVLIESMNWRYSQVRTIALSLVPYTPPPFPNSMYVQYILVYTGNVWLGGGLGEGEVFCCVGDHILQEFFTLYLTRFKTYKIAFPPNKNLRGVGGLRQINTCGKVALQVNFFDNDIWHCFLSV
jgi:hypothetical protein